jgi:hypothetical protein
MCRHAILAYIQGRLRNPQQETPTYVGVSERNRNPYFGTLVLGAVVVGDGIARSCAAVREGSVELGPLKAKIPSSRSASTAIAPNIPTIGEPVLTFPSVDLSASG